MQKRSTGLVYSLVLFFITLTGFAQMPIFKRYYIADIPGLGWLAKFYVTHSLHYALAVVLIALVVFVLTDFMLRKRGLSALTILGLFKGAMVLGLVFTGVLMVLRNLPGIHFSHVTVYVMDLAHLGFCMALLGASAFGAVTKRGWIR